MEANGNYHQQAMQFAEAGKHTEALDHIQRHLETSPNDAEALNDAGAILHCLGRSSEAIEYILKALSIQNDSPEILWNLSEAYLGDGQAKEAAEFFERMHQLDILNVDVLNRAARIFIDQDQKAKAIEILLYSQQLWPNQRLLEPMLNTIKLKRPKIAFFCGADGMTFLDEIVQFAKQRFDVRVFEGQTEDELKKLMKWSDISWFEWCTNLAASASKLPKVCKNIVRLHRYEAYTDWPSQINWDNIDALVMVGNKITNETLVSKVPDIQKRTAIQVIPNGVNLTSFQFNDHKRGKNIAFLANLRMVKNPAFVLQCMQKLHFHDPDYRLFMGGSFQDEVLEKYLRHMTKALGISDVVFFDGWQSDVNQWLSNKHYIVSTSVCEGHPVGLLEGMACGLKPVIHNFLGAEDIFPSEFLFNISEEFCQHILSDEYDPQRYRKFVEENYSLKDQLRKVNDLFTQFETQMDSQPSQFTNAGFTPEMNAPVFENNTFV